MFQAGEQVRCVDARNSAKLLREGEVYTVAASNDRFVFVRGVVDLRPGFYAHRFRRATDISNLTALLVEPSGSTTRPLVPV